MGTIGGKVGYGIGLFVFVAPTVPVIHLTPGPCFFEGECGKNQGVGLTLALAILIAASVASGLLSRLAVNALARSLK